MKKISHLVLLGEIIVICILHAIKINQSSEIIPSVTNQKVPVIEVTDKNTPRQVPAFPLSLPDFTSFINHTYG